MNMNVKRMLNRAARTFAQAFLGTLLAAWQLLPRDVAPTADILKKVGVSALVAAIVALVSFLHNGLEDVVPAVDTRQG